MNYKDERPYELFKELSFGFGINSEYVAFIEFSPADGVVLKFTDENVPGKTLFKSYLKLHTIEQFVDAFNEIKRVECTRDEYKYEK